MTTLAILTAAFFLYFLTATILLGEVFPEFVLLLFICATAFFLVLIAASTLGFQLLKLFLGRRLGPKSVRVLASAWLILTLVVLLGLAGQVAVVPVPKGPAPSPSAFGTLRTTASDMASFLVEVANPQHLRPNVADQMLRPQVSLSPELSWGLGYGIQHSSQGDALWQWGQTLDFQSIMIMYPAQGLGVVVFTNSDLLNPDVAIEIAHRAVGGNVEPIRRASHLEFNNSDRILFGASVSELPVVAPRQ